MDKSPYLFIGSVGLEKLPNLSDNSVFLTLKWEYYYLLWLLPMTHSKFFIRVCITFLNLINVKFFFFEKEFDNFSVGKIYS